MANIEAGIKQKILFCGDVNGNFDALFTRTANIHRKSGPFDALFCVGNFFGESDSKNSSLAAYKSGLKSIPLPTYITSVNTAEQVAILQEHRLDGSNDALCPNLYYLGRRGIYTTDKGVKVAYINGLAGKQSTDYVYNSSDCTDLYKSASDVDDFHGVDVLLTAQWATDVTRGTNVDVPEGHSSDLAAWLTLKLTPRYHICALNDVYFERAPFRCASNSNTIRFIALAHVANATKQKWLYALSLTPRDQMKMADLTQRTTDETDCPYSLDRLNQKLFGLKRKSNTPVQYFYDMSMEDSISNVSATPRPRRSSTKRPHFDFDQSKCWFCLSSPNVEKHLIITVGQSSYLTLPKGGLVDEHLLISPIDHHQNSVSLPFATVEEMSQFKRALCAFYKRQQQQKIAVFIERNYKTSHMLLQVVPVPVSDTFEPSSLVDLFVSSAQAFNLDLRLLTDQQLCDVYQRGQAFITIEIPEYDVILYSSGKIPAGFPLTFDREVLSGKALLNLGENRIDWRQCTLSKSDEVALVERIRKEFQPFDFT